MRDEEADSAATPDIRAQPDSLDRPDVRPDCNKGQEKKGTCTQDEPDDGGDD